MEDIRRSGQIKCLPGLYGRVIEQIEIDISSIKVTQYWEFKNSPLIEVSKIWYEVGLI